MARPGIMIYFDILEPVRMLSDADKGRLFVAMLEYGRDGTVPELDGALGIVWSFIHTMIDNDGQRYDDMKLQREYAAFCKKRKRIWMPKILFDDWVCMTEDERQRAVDPVASRNPTATTTNNIQPTVYNQQYTSNNVQLQPSVSTTNPHQPSAENGGGSGDPKSNVTVMGGELGKGVVFISQEQTDDLLDRMDIDTFDYYVDKLSSFIIKNGAHVRNHYETILKWWQEDSVVRKQGSFHNEIPKGASGKLGQAELDAIGRVLADAE